MKLRVLFLLGLFVGFAGCATPPQEYNFSKSETYSGTFDQVWSNVVKYLTDNDIGIKTIDKSSGIIYTDSYNISAPNDVMDCGTSIAQVLSSSGSMNILVVKNSNQTITATINTTFQEVRINPLTAQPPTFTVDCVSTGNLEQTIFTQLGNPSSTSP